jgi:hypothetical protein
MGAEGPREAAFLGCVAAVMDAGPGNELEAVREAVALAVERRWLGAAAAARAARLLAAGAALEAARLLVPPGWSVAVAAVDPRAGPEGWPPAPPEVVYVARSAPEGLRTDRMAVRFGPDDACHMPDHGFRTAALALCGEAMMLQMNLEGDARMAPP